MSTALMSYVHAVLLANHAPSYGVNAARWRWRRLTSSLFDPYRPELHYRVFVLALKSPRTSEI